MMIFVELSIIIFIAALCAFLAKLLRQPLLVGYIAAGVLVGPSVLDLLHSTEEVELFSKIGISILLFIVGLHLNPDIIREVGKSSLFAGLGQITFTALAGYLFFWWLGFAPLPAFYGAMALTFSSTIIVLKLLADKGDIGKLYAKISIGILLVQDLVATLLLVALTVSGAGAGAPSDMIIKISLLLLQGLAMTGALYLISKYFLPGLAKAFAADQELLFGFSLAWGLGLAALFQLSGFSIEIGALVAGVTLAASPFAYEIGARLKPLRDFFVILFFVLLGAQMSIGSLGQMIVPAIVLSLFVLIGNPVIVFFVVNSLGYRPRTSFMAGLTLGQISEFSLILITLGLSLGHINQDLVSLVTLVGVITIVVSTYLVMNDDRLYHSGKKLIDRVAWRKKTKRESKAGGDMPEMVILGYDRVGYDFVTAAQKLKARYVVVDFNPRSIAKLEEKEIPFKYGDAEDLDFLQEIGFAEAGMIVSTIPDFKTNMLLVNFYRKHNSGGIIMVISHDVAQTRELYLAGASYVIMPHYLGAHHASELIKKHGFDLGSFEKERNKHLAKLAKRD